MDLRVPFAAVAVTAVAVTVAASDHPARPTNALLAVANTQQQADLEARVMLDRAYQLGAVRLPEPTTYTSLPFRRHEVEQSRWLSAPGSPAQLVAGITAHPPTGFVVTSSSRLIRATDDAYYGQTVELKPYGLSNSSLHVLDVTAFPATRARSTVLVQASVGWVPPRTAAERIPDDATSATLDLGLGTAPEIYRHLDLSAQQTNYLAFLVNQLPSTSEDQYVTCPGPELGTAVIGVPATGAEYRLQLGGCHQVTVTVAGVGQPMLLGDDGFDFELTKMLGTTPNG